MNNDPGCKQTKQNISLFFMLLSFFMLNNFFLTIHFVFSVDQESSREIYLNKIYTYIKITHIKNNTLVTNQDKFTGSLKTRAKY